MACTFDPRKQRLWVCLYYLFVIVTLLVTLVTRWLFRLLLRWLLRLFLRWWLASLWLRCKPVEAKFSEWFGDSNPSIPCVAPFAMCEVSISIIPSCYKYLILCIRGFY